jgi:DAK2 domain fusion protein YloV
MDNLKTYDLGGELFLNMLKQGCARLGSNRKEINDLNVFPIPDGDTGDNMTLTIESGFAQASQLKGATLGEIASAASSGMLMGARGNSGVILSRIFSGFAKSLAGKEGIGTKGFADAMQAAVEEAYGSVSKPVEGTILTVVREGTESALPFSSDTLETYMARLLQGMEISLEKTPEKLQVLKEAGVVDSGGAGLLQIFYGFQDALLGITNKYESASDAAKKPAVDFSLFNEDTELKFGYCTEFLLRLQRSKVDLDTFDEKEIEDYILSSGDSVVFFREGTIIKVHVHTKTPGDIISHCQRWGEFLTIKIENMTLQHNHSSFAAKKPEKKKDFGLVTVASGQGLSSAFTEAGADFVVEGGQTMNPSVADFVAAFDKVAARTIFVFPNNSNIVMTARQAAEVYQTADVRVIPTRDPGAGYVAIASFDPATGDASGIEQALCEVASGVVCGMVSTSIRDTVKDGVEVSKGGFIGFRDSEILSSASSRNEAAEALCRALDASSHDVVVVFTGADAAGDADALQASLESAFPTTEFMFREGGQTVFDYILILC